MVLELPGMGKASTCQVCAPAAHRPVPLRFVWHHVMPLEAGGQTVPSNLIEICDSCHYTIHRLMWYMAHGTPLPKVRQAQLAFARQGYEACAAAGTVSQIPDEG